MSFIGSMSSRHITQGSGTSPEDTNVFTPDVPAHRTQNDGANTTETTGQTAVNREQTMDAGSGKGTTIVANNLKPQSETIVERNPPLGYTNQNAGSGNQNLSIQTLLNNTGNTGAGNIGGITTSINPEVSTIEQSNAIVPATSLRGHTALYIGVLAVSALVLWSIFHAK
jgi:hypothetical protein